MNHPTFQYSTLELKSPAKHSATSPQTAHESWTLASAVAILSYAVKLTKNPLYLFVGALVLGFVGLVTYHIWSQDASTIFGSRLTTTAARMDMQIAYSSGYSQTSDAVSRGIVVGTVASEQQRRDIVAGHFFKDCKAGMCTNWTSYSSFKSNILKSPSFQRQKPNVQALVDAATQPDSQCITRYSSAVRSVARESSINRDEFCMSIEDGSFVYAFVEI